MRLRRTASLPHRTWERVWRSTLWFGPLVGIAAALLLFSAFRLPGTVAADVPVIKGDLGPCTADFTVTDSKNNPLYDAKIHVTVRYGFLSKRKSELEIGTNSDGRARVEGLPSKVKKPVEIAIRHGENVESMVHDPGSECQASFAIVLGRK